jgi:hypothetical protein
MNDRPWPEGRRQRPGRLLAFPDAGQVSAVFALSACLALCLCFISENLNARFNHHTETVHNQVAILKAEPLLIDGEEVHWPYFQSRVIFPILLAAASRAHFLSLSQSYLILRFATAFMAMAAFMFACIACGAWPKIAAFGAAALAYGTVLTFNYPWGHPTDFIDIIVFSAAVGLGLKRRRWAITAVLLVGTLNHQTAAFIGVIWFCLWGLDGRYKLRLRECAYAAAMAIASYSLTNAVKFWVGPDRSLGYPIAGGATLPYLVRTIRHLQPFDWPVFLPAMWLPVILWLIGNRREISEEVRRLVGASLLTIALSSVIASWVELRSVFLAPLVIATFAATLAEARAQDVAAGRGAEAGPSGEIERMAAPVAPGL